MGLLDHIVVLRLILEGKFTLFLITAAHLTIPSAVHRTFIFKWTLDVISPALRVGHRSILRLFFS